MELGQTPDGSYRFQCHRCQTEFIYSPPIGEIMNSEKISMVVWVHENEVNCSNCGQRHAFTVMDVSTRWTMAPIKDGKKELPKVIIPPAGMAQLLKK